MIRLKQKNVVHCFQQSWVDRSSALKRSRSILILSPSHVKKTRQKREFSSFFDICWTKNSKQKQHGVHMLNFQDISDLINKKCFNGLKNEYNVQLVSHKFHNNGKIFFFSFINFIMKFIKLELKPQMVQLKD